MPRSGSLDASIDTTRLPDGPNTVVARVTDTSGNVAEQRSTVNVDNTAPTVATPTVRGGSGWRAVERVRARARRDGRAARLGRALGGAGRSAASTGRAASRGRRARQSRERGRHAARRPASGRSAPGRPTACATGPKSAWSEPLRFDDAAPGSGDGRRGRRLDERRRRVERRRQLPGRARRSGPSGISGYAVTRGDAAPGTTVTDRGDRVLVSLGVAPRGHDARARPCDQRRRRAVGAGRRGPRAHRPHAAGRAAQHRRRAAGRAGGRVAAAGRAPDGPRRRPGAALRDGARPRTGEPVTRGGHLEYQVDDDPLVRVRGASETIDLPHDGLHVVTVRAVDVAGQREQPAARELPRRPQQARGNDRARSTRSRRAGSTRRSPRSASTARRSSCSRAERGSGRAVPAQLEQRAVTGLVPDDRLPAGDYAARFRVRDCAGNEGLVAYGGATGRRRSGCRCARRS